MRILFPKIQLELNMYCGILKMFFSLVRMANFLGLDRVALFFLSGLWGHPSNYWLLEMAMAGLLVICCSTLILAAL